VLAGGHLVIALTILLGVIAAQGGLNVLHALVALLLAFQAVSGFRSFLVLRRIEVEVGAAPRVDAGGEAHLEVLLRNRKRRSASLSLEVEPVVEGAGRATVGPAWVARLEAGAETRVRLPVCGLARGVERLVEVRVSTRYPCDLFRRTTRFVGSPQPGGTEESEAEILVRPARRSVAPPDRASPGVGAERARVAVRADGEFRGLRPWRAGDPLRAVHWRATARVGALVVREEEASARRPWVVVVDPGPARDSADVDAALEALLETAAAVLRRAEREGRDAFLLLAGEATPLAVRDRRSLDVALDALARFEATGAPPPAARIAGRAFLLGTAAKAPAGSASAERAPFAWDRSHPARAAVVS
jgi:uncharacterized protein (DUF58 family)